jgi:hypothetical protein
MEVGSPESRLSGSVASVWGLVRGRSTQRQWPGLQFSNGFEIEDGRRRTGNGGRLEHEALIEWKRFAVLMYAT